jgi:hypothetical protein
MPSAKSERSGDPENLVIRDIVGISSPWHFDPDGSEKKSIKPKWEIDLSFRTNDIIIGAPVLT